MAYDLSYLRNRVLNDKLDDTSFDPDIVDRFLNDTQRSICNLYELPFMEQVFNGALTEGSYLVQFPTNYQTLLSLVLTSPTNAKRNLTRNYVPYKAFNDSFPTPANNTPGIPTVWTSFGNQLYLDRPTDDDYTLSLWYIKSPTDMEDDTDVPHIPEPFEEVLVLGAYIRVLERNEDFDLAAYYRNGAYADEVDKLLQRLGTKQLGKTPTIGQPYRYGHGRRSARR